MIGSRHALRVQTLKWGLGLLTCYYGNFAGEQAAAVGVRQVAGDLCEAVSHCVCVSWVGKGLGQVGKTLEERRAHGVTLS